METKPTGIAAQAVIDAARKFVLDLNQGRTPCYNALRDTLAAYETHQPTSAPQPLQDAFELAGSFSEHLEGYDYAFKTWDDVVAFVTAWRSADPHAPVADAARGESVGVAGSMPGTDGFTMACFEASKVPVGTNLYLDASTQQPACASEAGEAFPYQRTFDAIAAATTIKGGNIAISVRKFQETYGSAQQAVTLTDAARDVQNGEKK